MRWALDPRHFETLLNLGALYTQRGRLEDAQACYVRAADARPALPHAHYNLGRLSQERGDPGEAAVHYRRALEADPGHAPAATSLGELAQQAGALDEAIALYRHAIEHRPGYAAAHNNLGTALQHEGRLEDAVEQYRAATTIDPRSAEAHCNLGSALVELRRDAEAQESYERVLALEPGHATARFALSALRGENPERAPQEHVRSLFDDYAPNFDAHTEQRLEYRTPGLIAERLGALPECPSPRHSTSAAVPGCWARPLHRSCVQSMGSTFRAACWAGARQGLLPRARGSGHRRVPRAPGAECYDLVAAADVFVYLGALGAVFADTARVLRPGGWFAFSVESPAGDDESASGFALQPTGRYAHRAAYLEGLLHRHGLATHSCEDVVLRKQSNPPGSGQLWLARKSA
jgi:predicted TPR repeat methyltransferase